MIWAALYLVGGLSYFLFCFKTLKRSGKWVPTWGHWFAAMILTLLLWPFWLTWALGIYVGVFGDGSK